MEGKKRGDVQDAKILQISGPGNGSKRLRALLLLLLLLLLLFLLLLGFLLSDFQSTKTSILQPIVIKLRLQIGYNIPDFCTVSDF